MTNRATKKGAKHRADAKREKRTKPQEIVPRQTDAGTQDTGAVGTAQVAKGKAKAKAKPRAMARTTTGGLNLMKAIVEVLASSPGKQLSPTQVRVLVMRNHIKLGEVASLLELLCNERKALRVDAGRFTVAVARKVAKPAVRVLVEVVEGMVPETSGGLRGVSMTSLGTTVDLEDAVLAALCEEPTKSMTADEVQSRSVRYLGYTPERAAVVIALNSNPSVKSEGGGLYRGDCT
jgi:hypothetical protein